MYTKLEEQELIGRILAGESALFAELLGSDQRRLQHQAARLLGSDAEGEEVVQEALCKAFCHLSQFRGDASFSTWLFQIVINEARQRRRSRRRERAAMQLDQEVAVAADPGSPFSALDHLVAAETRVSLREAVTCLPAMYARVLWLRFVEGHNVAETARCLAVSKAAAKSRQHRACEMLRERLGTVSRAGSANCGRLLSP